MVHALACFTLAFVAAFAIIGLPGAAFAFMTAEQLAHRRETLWIACWALIPPVLVAAAVTVLVDAW